MNDEFYGAIQTVALVLILAVSFVWLMTSATRMGIETNRLRTELQKACIGARGNWDDSGQGSCAFPKQAEQK
jgi:hypothetical protein